MKTKQKVVPGLSLKGKDLMNRIRNGSIQLNSGQGQYIQNKEIADAMRLSKTDQILAARENAKKVSDLKSKLQSNG